MQPSMLATSVTVRNTPKMGGNVVMTNLGWTYLEGDGDFRSAEIRKLRDEADIIVTNPPFSLFREFVAWIVKAHKKFVILGNMNAITYKETFPLIQQDKMWLGASIHSRDREFGVPHSYVNCSQLFRVDDSGKKYLRANGVRWFTNIDHGRQNQPIKLMTMAENIERSKHQKIRELGYQTYDNYDAIEVPFTDAIPSDYEGVMGVPISFLSKYSPEQFEILGSDKYVPESIRRPNFKTQYVPLVSGKNLYARIFIRHRKAM